jgi:two-component system chemotaxis response regulator CheB
VTAQARRVRVLVVDDSAFVRRALARMLGQAPDLELVGLAKDGQEALDLARELRPDVITLDVQMPRLDGLTVLERLMRTQPTPVLLMSSQTRAGADVTLRGLELGALDFIDKGRAQGQMSLLTLGDELRAKVRALAGVAPRPEPGPPAAPAPSLGGGEARLDVVAVAASTGGPAALQTLMRGLPAGLPAALLIVQHIPSGFTRALAERLAARGALPVAEAQDGDPVRPGTALVAPGGRHLLVERHADQVRVRLSDEPRESLHRPSADVLMASLADAYGPRALGVVLTGMGTDGAVGLRAMRDAGGRTLAESPDTCVIYGMPKAALEAGAVERQVRIEALAAEIVTLVRP